MREHEDIRRRASRGTRSPGAKDARVLPGRGAFPRGISRVDHGTAGIRISNTAQTDVFERASFPRLSFNGLRTQQGNTSAHHQGRRAAGLGHENAAGAPPSSEHRAGLQPCGVPGAAAPQHLTTARTAAAPPSSSFVRFAQRGAGLNPQPERRGVGRVKTGSTPYVSGQAHSQNGRHRVAGHSPRRAA